MKDKQTFTWIKERLTGSLWYIILLAIMRSAVTVLGVAFALSSKQVIDAAQGKDIQFLAKSALILLFVVLSQLLIRLFGRGIETSIVAKLTLHIRSSLFKKLLSRDYSSLGKYHSGDLMTRISDDADIVASGIISLIPSVLALLIGLATAFWSLLKIDFQFAAIFFVGGLVILALLSFFKRLLKNTHTRVQEAESSVRSYFQEALSSILMIKVFGIEDLMSKKGDALQKENFKAQMRRRNLSISASSGLSLAFSIGSLYALIHSAYRLYLGAITFGTLTAVIQLVNQIQSPFAGLSGFMPQLYAILASSERIIEVENLPDDNSLQPPLNPGEDYPKLESINFEDISFGYEDELVLSKASLTINKGDFAVIGGTSGIGKSTLVKLLLGVIAPQDGKIYLSLNDGQIPIGKHTRPLFSYVPQGHLLLSGTIRDAVSVVNPGATDSEILEAAKICCALEFINELPLGLDTYIGEKGFGLSEGQIQRLALMRAIISGAPVLLLDEATSALDEKTESELLKNLRLLEGKTCIIISHKPAAFEVCNKHIFIEDKKVRTE